MRIDFGPLEAEVDGAAMVQRRGTDAPRALYVAAVFTGVGGGVTAAFAFTLAVRTAAAGGDRAGAYALLGAVALLLAAASIVGAVIWRRVHIRPVPSLARQAAAFATANGLDLVDEPGFTLPGWLFTPPPLAARTTPPVRGFRGFRPRTGRAFHVGDRWIATAGGARVTRPFVAVQLDRPLPRIVLVPRGIDPVFDLDKSQHLPLEGDFDSYFSLYCPADYETDALVVFTPDVMAAMVDGAVGWIAEIADDWLLFSRHGSGFDTATVDDYRRAFELVATVAPEVVEQSSRYSDDRVGGSAVDRIAQQGRALRAGSVWWAPLAGVGFALTLAAPVAVALLPLLP